MVLHEAASVAHPRLGAAAGVALDHLLGALLRVGAGAGRRGLGVIGHPAGAALGGISDALEASLLHDLSPPSGAARAAGGHVYAIGRARRARPLSRSGASDCGCAKNDAIGSPARCRRSRTLRRWKSSG